MGASARAGLLPGLLLQHDLNLPSPPRALPTIRARALLPQRAPAPQVSDELQRLAELRNSGVLSPTEYEQAKAKVLA